MRPSFYAFLGLSQDGFIARPDDGLDWLGGGPPPEEGRPREDYGFKAFFDSVDALAMGRRTFDVVSRFESWFYGTKPVYVLTSRPGVAEATPEGATVLPVSGSLDDLSAKLRADGREHVYVDGGRLVSSFLLRGWLDRLTMTRVPVVIGAGIPLFQGIDRDIRLKHVETRSWEDGSVQSTFILPAGQP